MANATHLRCCRLYCPADILQLLRVVERRFIIWTPADLPAAGAERQQQQKRQQTQQKRQRQKQEQQQEQGQEAEQANGEAGGGGSEGGGSGTQGLAWDRGLAGIWQEFTRRLEVRPALCIGNAPGAAQPSCPASALAPDAPPLAAPRSLPAHCPARSLPRLHRLPACALHSALLYSLVHPLQSKRYGDITLNSTADTVSCALNVRALLGLVPFDAPSPAHCVLRTDTVAWCALLPANPAAARRERGGLQRAGGAGSGAVLHPPRA